MFGQHSLSTTIGRTITLLSLPAGIFAGVATGVSLSSAPWFAEIIAMLVTVGSGALGFTLSGDIFATSCPCCHSHTIASTWRQTFQCQRCRTRCALATLRQQQFLSRRHLHQS